MLIYPPFPLTKTRAGAWAPAGAEPLRLTRRSCMPEFVLRCASSGSRSWSHRRWRCASSGSGLPVRFAILIWSFGRNTGRKTASSAINPKEQRQKTKCVCELFACRVNLCCSITSYFLVCLPLHCSPKSFSPVLCAPSQPCSAAVTSPISVQPFYSLFCKGVLAAMTYGTSTVVHRSVHAVFRGNKSCKNESLFGLFPWELLYYGQPLIFVFAGKLSDVSRVSWTRD